MGTRSLTVFMDEDQNEIAVLYRQFDGYPDGHGADILPFFKNRRVVNGFRMVEDDGNSNGMSNLAAQLIHFLFEKLGKPVGLLYLHPAGTRDLWENYIYTVYVDSEKSLEEVDGRTIFIPFLKLEASYGGGKVLYEGPAEDFDPEANFYPDEEE